MRNALLVFCLACAACQGTPKDAASWAKSATNKRNSTQERIEAIDQARKAPGEKKEAVPYLVELLKESAGIRAEAALALGEIRDPAAVQPLIKAVEMTDGGQKANREIARALGSIGDRSAVPALIDLLRGGDAYAKADAISALAALGDPAAVAPIIEVADGGRAKDFVVTTAIAALGQLGDPRAAPTLLRNLFRENPEIYFASTSAICRIGPPMVAPLLAVLKGEDKTIQTWASSNNVARGALYAKAAQILGDVGDDSAVSPLIQKLSYEDPDEKAKYLVRIYAAETLGRMRAKEAVKPIAELMVNERDPEIRASYCTSLVRIGDRTALPYFAKAAQAGNWEQRAGPLAAMSRLGDEPERVLIQKAKDKECRSPADKCSPDEAQERTASFKDMTTRLDASAECKQDVACWAKKLDGDPVVREQAALEVALLGGAPQADALAAAVLRNAETDADVDARYQAVLSLGWVTRPPFPGGAALAEKLETLVAREKTRQLTQTVNEEVQRLAIRLRRVGPK